MVDHLRAARKIHSWFKERDLLSIELTDDEQAFNGIYRLEKFLEELFPDDSWQCARCGGEARTKKAPQSLSYRVALLEERLDDHDKVHVGALERTGDSKTAYRHPVEQPGCPCGEDHDEYGPPEPEPPKFEYPELPAYPNDMPYKLARYLARQMAPYIRDVVRFHTNRILEATKGSDTPS